MCGLSVKGNLDNRTIGQGNKETVGFQQSDCPIVRLLVWHELDSGDQVVLEFNIGCRIGTHPCQVLEATLKSGEKSIEIDAHVRIAVHGELFTSGPIHLPRAAEIPVAEMK